MSTLLKTRLTWMSRIMIPVMLLAMLLTGCSEQPNSGFNTPEAQKQITANEDRGQKAQAMIKEVEPHLQLQPDGTLVIEQDKRATISPEALQFADSALADTNAQVKAGTITINPDLSIIVKGEHETRANEQWRKKFWWGWEFAINEANTNRILSIAGSVQSIIKLFDQIFSLTGMEEASGICQIASDIIQIGQWAIKYADRNHHGIYLFTYCYVTGQ